MDKEALLEYLGSQEFLEASKNSSRLVTKLKSAVQNQELYETHQILRTINFRFLSSREKIKALQNLLFYGSCFLLNHDEHVSGQDIGLLFLESVAKCLQHYQEEHPIEAKLQLMNPSLVYNSNEATIAFDVCQKLSQIIIKLPDTEIGQQKYVAEALRILSPKILDRNLLHNVVAETFWRHKDYANSRYHFLHCASIENAQDVAKLLVVYQTHGAKVSEIDLFITQFILQFLCLQCPLDTPKASGQRNAPVSSSNSNVSRKTRSTIKSIAEKVFSNYTINHPLLSQVCIPFSSLPLLNFTYFIISILDGNNETATFEVLRKIYRVAWNRDPNYQGYLTRIGTLYFGIVDPTKQRQGGGLFSNILQSLFDGADGDDDEDSNQEITSYSSCDELD